MPKPKKTPSSADPTTPMSFQEMVQRALKDPKFANSLHKLAKRAVTDDAALAELNNTFAFSPAELKCLGISDAETRALGPRCTVPTRTWTVTFLPFLPGHKK